MKYDGLIFDLDGTLWDAGDTVLKAWQHTLKRRGVDFAPTRQNVDAIMGMAMGEVGEVLFPKGTKDPGALYEACARAEVEFLEQHGAELYPRLRETLEELKKDYPLFIVSNCQQGYIEAFLSYHDMPGIFTDFECEGNTGLPKYRNIGALAARNGLKNPVYIGDTPMDAAAAEKAGTAFIWAAYGFGTVENAPLKLERLADLPALLAAGP